MSVLWAATAALLVAVAPASAAVVRVPADHATIASALAAAAVGDTVEVACGTWYEHGLVVDRPLTLRGVGADPSCTTIDGEGIDRVIDVTAGAAGPVVIENLTITGGYRRGGFLAALGGGVRAMDADLRLRDCIITGNGGGIGGGLGVQGGRIEAASCTFSGNAAADSAWAGGGGAWCRDAAGSLADCVFTANTAFSDNPGDPGDGGGLFMNNSRLLVADSVFNLNDTGGGAGALYSVDTDSAHVLRCTFTDNTARWGGALFVENAAAWIDSCTVEANTATSGGGASFGRGATPTVTATTFHGNAATASHGGAVESLNSRPVFTGCTFTANTAASWGGAVQVSGPSSSFTGCVMAGNTAGTQGGAIRLAYGTAAVTRCTIVANGAPLGGALCCQIGGVATVSGSIIADAFQGAAVYLSAYLPLYATCTDIHGNAGGDWTGAIATLEGVDGNISADPQFVDAAGGDYRLQGTSPCAPWAPGGCGGMGALAAIDDPTPVPPAAADAGALHLWPNYPNPFNPSTTLRFALPESGPTRVAIHDAAGRLVRVLQDGTLAAGEHALRWDGRDGAGRNAAAGVYFCRVASGGRAAVGRMVLLK